MIYVSFDRGNLIPQPKIHAGMKIQEAWNLVHGIRDIAGYEAYVNENHVETWDRRLLPDDKLEFYIP